MESEIKEIKEKLDTMERYLIINAKENLEEKIVQKLKKEYSKAVKDDPRETIKSYRDVDIDKEDGKYTLNGNPLSQAQCFKLEGELKDLGFNDLDEVVDLSKEEKSERLDERLEEWKNNTDREDMEKIKHRLEELIENEFFIMDDSDDLGELMEQYDSMMKRLEDISDDI